MRSRFRVGLFIQGGAYAYQTGIVFGAHDECEKRNLDFCCFAGGSVGRHDPRSYAYRIPSAADLDAALLVPGTWGAPLDHPETIALLDRYASVPRCVIGAKYGDAPSIRVDNTTGVTAITRHLIEVHGRRRIGFITGHGAESLERQQGYERALTESALDVDPELVHPGNFLPDAGRDAVERWFGQGGARCDAIVAANDWMALGALEALRERGLRVPDDVALVGFDDIEQASFLSPPLSTIRQPPRLLGKRAVEMIDALLGGSTEPMHWRLPTELEIRQSCGCFPNLSRRRELRISGLPAQTTLGDARGALLEVLVEAAGSLAKGLPDVWAEELLDAFADELAGRNLGAFGDKLGEWIVRAKPFGTITIWHYILGCLRDAIVDRLAGNAWLLAEPLFQNAHILVGEHAARAQGERLLFREKMILLLDETSAAARTAVDLTALESVLVRHLPGLGVPSCTVALGGGDASSSSEQVMAFDQQRGLESWQRGASFRTGELMLPALRPEGRRSLIVHPLFVHDEALGFCCLEVGPPDGSIYKALGDIIGSAVRAIRLSDALVEEATRRERAEKARLAQELEIAVRIQTAIVPRQSEVECFEIATAMVPTTEVGGDYFDVLPFEGGFWLGIGDVAGHGLHTGLVMLMIQSVLAAIVRGDPNIRPARAWRTLNTVITENVRERLGRDEHATLTLLRCLGSGEIVFAGAHEDIIILREATGRIEIVPTPGTWAGIRRDALEESVVDTETRLFAGDVLLLYTDGITEATNAKREMYGIERLAEALRDARSGSARAIRDRILGEVSDFMDTQFDDLTLVVARYLGPTGAKP
jgi:DNA-binding LacI/PurR family transcriptional regulator/serine phosphatase RsbU (regulator of sigma subunit)